MIWTFLRPLVWRECAWGGGYAHGGYGGGYGHGGFGNAQAGIFLNGYGTGRGAHDDN